MKCFRISGLEACARQACSVFERFGVPDCADSGQGRHVQGATGAVVATNDGPEANGKVRVDSPPSDDPPVEPSADNGDSDSNTLGPVVDPVFEDRSGQE